MQGVNRPVKRKLQRTKRQQTPTDPELDTSEYANVVSNPLLLVLSDALGNPCNVPDFLHATVRKIKMRLKADKWVNIPALLT